MTAVTAEQIEKLFSSPDAATRFANFCNALLVAQAPKVGSLPRLNEKQGSDGGIDAEWRLPSNAEVPSSPLTRPGWNVYQFKSCGIEGGGRDAAYSNLKSKVRGAVRKVVKRLVEPQTPAFYVLFTNLQLGVETKTTTDSGALLQRRCSELQQTILADTPPDVEVKIIDAAQLAALANNLPAVHLAYFSTESFLPWEEKWKNEQDIRDYRVEVPFIGRDEELKQVGAWLAADSIRVICISAPSGMGKTRLALEATRALAPFVVFVEQPEALFGCKATTLKTTQSQRVFVVEDPELQLLDRLAEWSFTAPGIKLILTVPSATDTPTVRLRPRDGVEQLVLRPLNRDAARNLLDSADAKLDHRAREWVLLQAGGVPDILLAAAEAGAELRSEAEGLRSQLAEKFRRRIVSKLDENAFTMLRLLSPLQAVNTDEASGEICLLCELIAPQIHEVTVRQVLESLERLGYARRRGKYVSVVPPLFAAHLLRDVLNAQPSISTQLFQRLKEAGQKRFLERLITAEPDDAKLWDHIFGPEGVFGNSMRAVEHLSLLDYLARAVPRRTLLFLQRAFDELLLILQGAKFAGQQGDLLRIVHELVEEPEAAEEAMELLELLALRDLPNNDCENPVERYCERFVHWYPLPLSFERRVHRARKLATSNNTVHRNLGVRCVVTATNYPHSLSGGAVNARRLGGGPTWHTLNDEWTYLEAMLQLRFELCALADKVVSDAAKDKFFAAVEQISEDLPAVRFLPILEKAVQWHREGRLADDVSDVRHVLQWTKERYKTSMSHSDQERWHKDWSEALTRIDALIAHYEQGSFLCRLKLAVGRQFEFNHQEVNGVRIYEYERRAQAMAEEVAANPAVMSDEAWHLVGDENAYNVAEFAASLGRVDRGAALLEALEKRSSNARWAWIFGLYLWGRHKSEPAVADSVLDRLIDTPTGSKLLALTAIKLIGPTDANWHRLEKLLVSRTVTPLEIAHTFSTGGWLNGQEPLRASKVFEFIASAGGMTNWVLQNLSLYVFSEKPLPRELFALAERVLLDPPTDRQDCAFERDCIALGMAKTDIEAALSLLDRQVVVIEQCRSAHRDIWIPIPSHGQRRFWEFLRTNAPEKAYRIFGRFKPPPVWSGFRNIPQTPVLDLQNHGQLLLTIAREDRGSALVFAAASCVSQFGFFDFAYGLLDIYPNDDQVKATLSDAVCERSGFGSDREHCSRAISRIEEQVRRSDLPVVARHWLTTLKNWLNDQMNKERRCFRDDDHVSWD